MPSQSQYLNDPEGRTVRPDPAARPAVAPAPSTSAGTTTRTSTSNPTGKKAATIPAPGPTPTPAPRPTPTTAPGPTSIPSSRQTSIPAAGPLPTPTPAPAPTPTPAPPPTRPAPTMTSTRPAADPSPAAIPTRPLTGRTTRKRRGPSPPLAESEVEEWDPPCKRCAGVNVGARTPARCLVARDRRHRDGQGNVRCEKCHRGKKSGDLCAPDRERLLVDSGEWSYSDDWKTPAPSKKRPRISDGASDGTGLAAPRVVKKSRSADKGTVSKSIQNN